MSDTTSIANAPVASIGANNQLLEFTEDEKSALENMSGLDRCVLLMLSLSEEDAAQITFVGKLVKDGCRGASHGKLEVHRVA